MNANQKEFKMENGQIVKTKKETELGYFVGEIIDIKQRGGVSFLSIAPEVHGSKRSQRVLVAAKWYDKAYSKTSGRVENRWFSEDELELA